MAVHGAGRRSGPPRVSVPAHRHGGDHDGDVALGSMSFGHKSFWPAGRYSSLSGFAEVGEMLEGCCVRETAEESGLVINPTTLA